MSMVKDIIQKQVFEKETWKQQKQEMREKAFQMVDEAAMEVVATPENFQKYLDIESRNNQYSYRNLLLVFAQKPEATQIKDAKAWNEQHIYIKRNEKSFIIVEPNGEYKRDDGTTGTMYNAKSMFDISQTNAATKKKNQTIAFNERNCLKTLLMNAPVNIDFKENLPNDGYAYYDPSDRTIYILPDVEGEVAFSAVAKELAHAQMDPHDGTYDRSDTAFHAYCCAYMMNKQFGLDTSNFDFGTVKDRYADAQLDDIKNDLSQLRNTHASISERVNKSIYVLQEKQKTEKQER